MSGLALDSISTGAILIVVVSGMLLVFGMMRIINFAHGAFMTIGAYGTVVGAQIGLSYWWALCLSVAGAMVVAMAVEPIIIRRLYGRPLDMILATWGLNLIIVQLLVLYFGRGTYVSGSPGIGAIDFGGVTYSGFRLVLVIAALAICAIFMLVLKRTRAGLLARAVIMDEHLTESLGIDSKMVRFVTFTLGSAMAGLAGGLVAPLLSVDPTLGNYWLLIAFMLSLLVGVSIRGLLLTGLVFGTAQVLVGTLLNATVATLVVPLLVVTVLRFRPAGFARQATTF
ncbi:branched-chain amino acid ABC transporter permease [Georgenia subflava]|uniref:Branched-chain amino acid ABC transporter permease n=1 Tax=Georgenia subflava TaxID=1622177 RepID=A0A6N7EMP7_9MICO|nr:branched-chain amino acid ABC transporter permease [Georgenia subflava]MPV38363.1 branched-chain amino acid ABC transporter permease [Georgenia subflava]